MRIIRMVLFVCAWFMIAYLVSLDNSNVQPSLFNFFLPIYALLAIIAIAVSEMADKK